MNSGKYQPWVWKGKKRLLPGTAVSGDISKLASSIGRRRFSCESVARRGRRYSIHPKQSEIKMSQNTRRAHSRSMQASINSGDGCGVRTVLSESKIPILVTISNASSSWDRSIGPNTWDRELTMVLRNPQGLAHSVVQLKQQKGLCSSQTMLTNQLVVLVEHEGYSFLSEYFTGVSTR